MTTDKNYSRRRYLGGLMTLGTVALAGCSGSGSDDDGTGDEDDQTRNRDAGRNPITFSGTSSSSGETVQMQDGLVVAESSHGGSGRFEIALEGGQFPHVLVSANGAFDGKEATYTEAREYILNVVANGSWELTIRQPRADSGESPPLPTPVRVPT